MELLQVFTSSSTNPTIRAAISDFSFFAFSPYLPWAVDLHCITVAASMLSIIYGL